MTTQEAERFNALVGALLRSKASFQKVSVAALARKAGIERTVLTRYLDGKRVMPLAVLYDVCDALALDPQSVMAEATAMMRAERRG